MAVECQECQRHTKLTIRPVSHRVICMARFVFCLFLFLFLGSQVSFCIPGCIILLCAGFLLSLLEAGDFVFPLQLIPSNMYVSFDWLIFC